MKLCMQAYIHKISDEFDNQANSGVNKRVTTLCCFITVRHCVHNNVNKYEWILMKLCTQLYINKISDEFYNDIDSSVTNRVMAL